MKRIIIYIISAISLIACEDDVDVKDLGIEPKMVLYCYLSPMFDTNLVFLSNSQPIFSSETNDLAVINNATVELSNNGKTWVKCKYDNIKERYILPKTDFPILEGKTYYIRAKAPGFKETIKSSCVVPYYRDIDLEIDTMVSYENAISTMIKWKDFAGEANYYSFCVYEISSELNESLEDTNIYLKTHYVYDLKSNSRVFSDEGKDGSTLSFESYLSNQYGNHWDFDTIMFTINQTNKDLYIYEKSFNEYYNSAGLSGLVEPSLLYNNIENGYGLFTAFVFKKFTYDFINRRLSEFVFQ